MSPMCLVCITRSLCYRNKYEVQCCRGWGLARRRRSFQSGICFSIDGEKGDLYAEAGTFWCCKRGRFDAVVILMLFRWWTSEILEVRRPNVVSWITHHNSCTEIIILKLYSIKPEISRTREVFRTVAAPRSPPPHPPNLRIARNPTPYLRSISPNYVIKLPN